MSPPPNTGPSFQRRTGSTSTRPDHRLNTSGSFGWIKTVGAGRKLRYIGNDRNRAWFKIEVAVHYLIRITTLDAATA